jgi:hypothetical protein
VILRGWGVRCGAEKKEGFTATGFKEDFFSLQGAKYRQITMATMRVKSSLIAIRRLETVSPITE